MNNNKSNITVFPLFRFGLFAKYKTCLRKVEYILYIFIFLSLDPTCLALHERQIRITLIYLLLDFYAAVRSISQILSIVTCSSWNLAACAKNSTYYRLSNLWNCSWFSMEQVLHQHRVSCRGWNLAQLMLGK